MLRKSLIAAVGVAALGGAAVAAAPKAETAARDVHVLRVAMPDGSVQQVRYTGDVAPTLVFVPVRRIAAAPAAIDDMLAPLAGFDRMFAEMDREIDAMLRQAASMR